MPNHITNILTIDGPLPRVKEIFKKISPGPTEEELKNPPEEPDEPVFKPASKVELAKRMEGVPGIDFEKIVPGRPNTEGEDWYDWSIANWGTKWNAYDIEKIDDNTLLFNTAWSMPQPVIIKLSEMFPDVVFKIKWADEDTGSNCGELHYKNGEEIFTRIPEDLSKEAYELVFEIDPGLEEYYVYDEKEGTYKYQENEARLTIGEVVSNLKKTFDKLVEVK